MLGFAPGVAAMWAVWPAADVTLHGQRRHLSPLSMQLVTPGKSGDERGMPAHPLRSARCRRLRGGTEGLAARRTGAGSGGAGGVRVARSGPRASVADADRTRRV